MHGLRHHPDLHENPTPPAAPAPAALDAVEASEAAQATPDAEGASETAEATEAQAGPPGGRHLRVVEPVIDESEEARQRSRAAHPAGAGRRRARPKRAAG